MQNSGRASADNSVPVTPIVRRAGGVAYGVQDTYSQALRGIPCPRSVKLEDGKYSDVGEIQRPAPSIGQQYGQ